jgi:hypothetical protein
VIAIRALAGDAQAPVDFGKGWNCELRLKQMFRRRTRPPHTAVQVPRLNRDGRASRQRLGLAVRLCDHI